MRSAALVLGVVGLLTQSGCATMRLLDWSHDEVSIKFSTVKVKNVPSLPDGPYAIVVPTETTDWSRQPVVETTDGRLELSPQATLLLTTGWQSAIPGSPWFRVVEKADASRPYSRSGPVNTEFTAFIERLPGRNYRIHLLFGDETRHRWVQIGTVDIGPGTQSAMRRPIAYVALPGVVIVDVATIPVMIVVGVIMISAEGAGALAEKIGGD